MELLCPSCQKKLVIPDDFAGQMAKCPQCGNTFQAPTLPPAPGAFIPPPPIPSAPPPAPAAVAAPPGPALGDGHAPAAVAPPPAAPEEPRVDFGITLPPTGGAALPVPATGPVGDYKHRRSIWISPRFLRWVVAAAVIGVFVLSFFPWLGLYPGDVPVSTQSAWQAAFGSESSDKDVKDDKELAKRVAAIMAASAAGDDAKKTDSPGPNGMALLYILLLVPTLLLAVGVLAWEVLSLNLPPGIQRLRPLRWGIVFGVALLGFLFLVLQLFTGFSLEKQTQTTVDSAVQALEKTTSEKAVRLQRTLWLSNLHRTCALKWAFWLHLTAVVGALLIFWIERRGNKPLPRIDVLT